MDLKAKHLPSILSGGILGAGIGVIASFAFKPGVLPATERVAALRCAGLAFGAIVGMAVAVIALISKTARDPGIGLTRSFSSLNGWGSTLIGKPHGGKPYWVTEWFTITYIPIFPISRYKLIEHLEASSPFHHEYTILEKQPPRFLDVIKGYSVTVGVPLAIVGLIYLPIFTVTAIMALTIIGVVYLVGKKINKVVKKMIDPPLQG